MILFEHAHAAPFRVQRHTKHMRADEKHATAGASVQKHAIGNHHTASTGTGAKMAPNNNQLGGFPTAIALPCTRINAAPTCPTTRCATDAGRLTLHRATQIASTHCIVPPDLTTTGNT